MSTDDLIREQPLRRIEPEQAKKPETETAERAATPDAVKQEAARRDELQRRLNRVRGRGVELDGAPLSDTLWRIPSRLSSASSCRARCRHSPPGVVHRRHGVTRPSPCTVCLSSFLASQKRWYTVTLHFVSVCLLEPV